MSTEGTSWKALALLVLAGAGYYAYPHAKKLVSTEYVTTQTARNACASICANNNSILMNAMYNKGYFADQGTYSGMVDMVNTICDNDCEARFPK